MNRSDGTEPKYVYTSLEISYECQSRTNQVQQLVYQESPVAAGRSQDVRVYLLEISYECQSRTNQVQLRIRPNEPNRTEQLVYQESPVAAGRSQASKQINFRYEKVLYFISTFHPVSSGNKSKTVVRSVGITVGREVRVLVRGKKKEADAPAACAHTLKARCVRPGLQARSFSLIEQTACRCRLLSFA
jgi:hypothetical protein